MKNLILCWHGWLDTCDNIWYCHWWLEAYETYENIWTCCLDMIGWSIWKQMNTYETICCCCLSWMFGHMKTYEIYGCCHGCLKTYEHIWTHMLFGHLGLEIYKKHMGTYETVLCLTWLVGNIWKHMKQIWTYMLVLTWFVENRLKHMKTCVHMLCWTWLVGNIWKQLLFLTWMVGHIWKPFKTYVVVATVGWKHMKHMSTYENIWANAHNQSTTCFCCRCDSLACRNRILIFEKGIMWTCVHNVWGKISIWFWLTPCFFHHIGFGVTHIWHIMFFDHDLFKPGDAFFFKVKFFGASEKSDSRVPKQACDRVSRRIICFHVAPRLFRILECFHSCQGLEVFSVCVCVCLCVSVFVCDVWFSCVFGYLFIYMSLFVSVPQVAGAEGLLEQGSPAGGRGEWLGCWEGGWGQVGDGWWWQRA